MKDTLIVLVEDSERYIHELLAIIWERLEVPGDRIDVVRTEVEFYDRLPNWETSRPSVFIVDVMVPYMEVGGSDDSVPAAVRDRALRDSYYRAGIRCVDALLSSKALHETPIIVHSILDEEALRSDEKYPLSSVSNVNFWPKQADHSGIIHAVAVALGRGAANTD